MSSSLNLRLARPMPSPTSTSTSTIVSGDLYFFKKSGNRVRALSPTEYGGKGSWVVERVDGSSVGKQMVVPGRALVTALDD